MALNVVDAATTTQILKTTLSGSTSQHIPSHIVDGGFITVSGVMPISGAVAISGPVTISGTVAAQISGPVTISGGGGFITVSGTVFATASGIQTISGAVAISGAVVISGGGGFLTISGSGGFITVTGNVLVSGVHPVTVSGAVVVSGGGGFFLISGSGGFITVSGVTVGNVAHGTADSGNPVKVGGFALTTHSVSGVISGARTNFLTDKYGSQVFTAWPVDLITTTGRLISVTGETVIVVATASEFHDILWMDVTHNGTSQVLIQFRDVTTSGTLHQRYLAAGGGMILPFGSTPLIQGTATAWTAAITTSDVTYSVNVMYRRRI